MDVIRYSSGELTSDEFDLQSLECSLKQGLEWECKIFKKPTNLDNEEEYVYMAWNFEWDEKEISGFQGQITAEQLNEANFTSFDFPVELLKSGVWIEHRLASTEAEYVFKYGFELTPLTVEHAQMDEHFSRSELTDAILVVEDQELHVNKAFLAIHSKFFRSMFFSEFKEKSMDKILIEDVTYRDFARLLSVVYPKPYRPNDISAEKLLELADRFMMPGVTFHVELFLVDHSEIPDSRLLYLADKYGLEDLMSDTMKNYEAKEQIKELKSTPVYAKFSDAFKSVLLDRLIELV